ncbi:Tf2-6, partial [Mucuna pruriens]
MKEGDEWKTTFKTKLGLCEWMVMPFGLTNVPSAFMRLMNHVLRSLISKCMVIYFNDILVYSSCIGDYILHTRMLVCESCALFVHLRLFFWGYVVGSKGVKVAAENTLASPLNEIIKKDVGFKWDQSEGRAFQDLKERLTNAPILALPNFSKTFKQECNASNMELESFKYGIIICCPKSLWSTLIMKPLNILGVKISLVKDRTNGLSS